MALFNIFKKKKKEETSEISKIKEKKITKAKNAKKIKEVKKTEKVKKIEKSEEITYNKKERKEIITAPGILKSPQITEKASNLSKMNQYVFKVYPRANKTEVQRAIEELYGVKVEKVNMVHLPPKKRRLGQREGWKDGLKQGFKKAIVTLLKGEKIEAISR